MRRNLYDGLKKYKSLKEAAGGNPCMIVLYELHDSTKRNKVGVGHYSLVILGAKTRYWSSYGYPVDFEISATHSKDLLKDLLGDHVNLSGPRTHPNMLEVVSLTCKCVQNARSKV